MEFCISERIVYYSFVISCNNYLFQPELIKEYQHIIYQNIIKGMKVLVDARDKLNIPWENPKNYDIGYQLLKFENTMVLDARLFLRYVPSLQSLWKDASIKKAFDRRREFQLVRHTSIFTVITMYFILCYTYTLKIHFFFIERFSSIFLG